MKKFLLGTVGLMALGMAAPASAADMAVKAAPVPYIAPMYNWTGLYIGGNGGWGSSHSCWDTVDPFGINVRDICRSRSGGVVGGQIGYRWQASQWVFGLEAQGDWADLSNQRISFLNPLLSTRTKTDGIGLAAGGEQRIDQADALAAEIRPIALGFHTKHPLTGLPTITDLATDKTT